MSFFPLCYADHNGHKQRAISFNCFQVWHSRNGQRKGPDYGILPIEIQNKYKQHRAHGNYSVLKLWT